jgi:hypothetical protein
MMFADALLEVLGQISRAAGGVSAVLFVYDELGDGLSAAASVGGENVQGFGKGPG